jgi:hypothetical protein
MRRSRTHERSVQIEVGRAFGVDVRPTRLFVWLGSERDRARILPFGRPPRLLRLPRRERHWRAGPVQVTVLGNPILTLSQAGVAIARVARREPTVPPERRLGPGASR